MPEPSSPRPLLTQFRGIAAIVAVYVYFLIFAQFAFLRLAQSGGVSPDQLRVLMGSMGVAGILASFLAGRRFTPASAKGQLRFGFALCSGAAFASIFAKGVGETCAVAFLIGTGVGTLTVTLAASLPFLLDARRLGFQTGLGTGIAYAICNIPAIFSAPPVHQATFAGSICLLGLGSMAKGSFEPLGKPIHEPVEFSFPGAVISFLALVWLDSAAFYILQQTPSLNQFGWASSRLQVQNAAIHFLAAIIAGLWLDRGGLGRIPMAAFLSLGSAALLVAHAKLGWADWAQATHWLYAAGVSLYSTALVFTPAAAAASDSKLAAKRAAVLYAVAGWAGSALGIGMAQNLQSIPSWFVAVAGLIVFGVAIRGGRKLAIVSATALAACPFTASAGESQPAAAIEPSAKLGREVYISEGCIHCHSQYVRPGTQDEEWWGPAQSQERILSQAPPLIGNRRQGPDLLNVGNRRSPQWNRIHLINPRSVSPASVMPSFGHLFKGTDTRGESLLLYLAELGADSAEERARIRAKWQPLSGAFSEEQQRAKAAATALFASSCAPCHGKDGRGDGPLVGELGGWKPRNLVEGQWQHIPAKPGDWERLVELARVVKFGIVGTPMAGHEYWSDQEVLAVSAYVQSLALRPAVQP